MHSLENNLLIYMHKKEVKKMVETGLSSVGKSDDISIVDERGNIRLESEAFGITLSLIKAGSDRDDVGREYSWDDSVKIDILTKGNKIGTLKLNAMQAGYLLTAFNHPEVKAELNRRIKAEREKHLAEISQIKL